MLKKVLRSMLLGLIIAGLMLAIFPKLRPATLFSNDETPLSFNRAVRAAAPSVVNVYNRNMSGNAVVLSLGSGVIMNKLGYILTNQHVVNDGKLITVILQDGRRFDATLIGSDLMTDLAVLKIEAENLPIIPINLKRETHVGDIVMAIGNPFNIGQTVTQGIISATGRIGLSPSGRQNFLQTDASINRGNSGGPLVNTLGELVGINTLTYDRVTNGETPEGLGFAIPAPLAIKVMNKLIKDGRVIRGYLGIQGKEIYAEVLEQFGSKNGKGILVSDVSLYSAAANAGFINGDIIIAVNNIQVDTALSVMDYVAEIKPGTTIPITVIRNNKKITLKLIVSEFPEIK